MKLIFTMSVIEFESVQNMKSVNALLKKYDASPMPDDINQMGFYNQG